MLSGNQIRCMFLDFFVQKGHREVHSSSLVPANDPTLLFTNAGMNQFKDVFLGLEKREYSRATTSQKCVRAGGKHNDLENVGFTNRHHTFFEMLGNFSFGDYFKRDAVAYAWELVTSPQWFGIAKDKLYVTIFKGENGVGRDDEAYGYWVEQGVPKDRIYEMGMKDNFWSMGDTGPCGPCSEIHYDMGVAASGEGHADCEFGCECGRYVEIWNLVFMQFDRSSDGVLNPLPKPSIDTGAGLERVTSVLQGVISNYDTDLFLPLIKRAAELTGVSLETEEEKEAHANGAASLRVIADHARAATFLISDGVMPANDGRGYVLRKIIRRAIRHGRLLGQNKPFLSEMVFAVRDEMKNAYPELIESAERVAKVVLTEETRFAHTLDIGLKLLDEKIQELLYGFPLQKQGRTRREENEVVKPEIDRQADSEIGALVPPFPGDFGFKLKDTYGLPEDFITDACRDAGIVFDQAGFDRSMEEQRSRARASWQGAGKQTASPAYQNILERKDPYEGQGGVLEVAHDPYVVRFVGYSALSHTTRVIAVFWFDPASGVDQIRNEASPGREWHIVLEETPFYATSGGQVGDRGWLATEDGNEILGDVVGSDMPIAGLRVLTVKPRKSFVVGTIVTAVVDRETREATMRHHTGTHLLHAALRQVLGTHVKQAGSLVDPGHLRFDFSHFTGVADEELQDIEDIANREVLRNDRVEIVEDVPIDVAVNEYHAMALFGEKYGERVRVIKIGDFSTELCGGTHTGATGEIGLIKILKEGSVSSGVRRLEAVAGEVSLQHFRKDHQLENVVSTIVGRTDHTPADALRIELDRREEELKRLRKELEQVRMKSAASAVSSADEQAKDVKGIKVLVHRADNLERPQLRTLVDNFRNKIGSGVVVIGSVADGKVAIIAGVTKDLTSRIQAGKIVGQVAQKVGGSGGGRPDMAEAGGKNPEALDQALREAYAVVESLLG